jgi:hypothetical protein
MFNSDRCGRDRIVVGFTNTYVINAYHHYSCEFESRAGQIYSIQHYVINCQNGLRRKHGKCSLCHEWWHSFMNQRLNHYTIDDFPWGESLYSPKLKVINPLQLWVRIPRRSDILDTTLCDKVFSDLRQVCGFLQIVWFLPPIKLPTMIQPR